VNDLERAISVALDAHEGDTDKAGTTYIRHPLRLMEAVDTENERIAAVLHDVVEDAEYTLDEIDQEFGSAICDAVDALTKRDNESYMEFVERSASNPIAREVKIADIEDNMDLTRLDSVDESVLKKQETYHEAWLKLQASEANEQPMR
jgi:GTP pyrophosphokinase